MKDKQLLAEWVGELIQAIGKSRPTISRKLGVNVKTLKRWESGECVPSAINLMNLYHLSKGVPLGA